MRARGALRTRASRSTAPALARCQHACSPTRVTSQPRRSTLTRAGAIEVLACGPQYAGEGCTGEAWLPQNPGTLACHVSGDTCHVHTWLGAPQTVTTLSFRCPAHGVAASRAVEARQAWLNEARHHLVHLAAEGDSLYALLRTDGARSDIAVIKRGAQGWEREDLNGFGGSMAVAAGMAHLRRGERRSAH